jgi:ketosteroid isomerase-like protein
MSRENVDLAKRYFAAETRLAARTDDSEVDAMTAEMLSTLHQEVVMDLGPLSLSRRGVYRGPEQLVEFARDEMNEAWSEYEIRVERALATGHQVVLIYSENLVARRSGVPAKRRAADVYEIEGGKIVSIRYYREPEEALAAVGLSG